MALLDSDFNIFIKPVVPSVTSHIVSSSAKLARLAFFVNKNNKNNLNKNSYK